MEAAVQRRDDLLALGAGLLTVVFWASAFVGIRDAGDDLSPGPLALTRLTVGSLILGAFVLARREKLPGRGNIRGLVLCGLSRRAFRGRFFSAAHSPSPASS